MNPHGTTFMKWWGRIALLLLLSFAVLLVTQSVNGQDPQPEAATITFNGAVVSDVTDEGIIVNGLLIKIDDVNVNVIICQIAVETFEI